MRKPIRIKPEDKIEEIEDEIYVKKPIRIKPEDKIEEIEDIEDELKPNRALAIPRALGQAIIPFGDELVGAAQTLPEATEQLLSGKIPEYKDLLENYKKYRDIEREKVKRSYKDYPVESYGTEIATMFAPGLAATKLGKIGKLARGIELLEKSPTSYGAVQGYAASESDDPYEQARDTIEGAATAKTLDLGFKGIGKLINKTPEILSPLLGVSPTATRKYIEKGSQYLENVPDIDAQESKFRTEIAPKAIKMAQEGSQDVQDFIKNAPVQNKSELLDYAINKKKELETTSGLIRSDDPNISKQINFLDDLIFELSPKEHLQKAASYPQIAESIETGILPSLREDIKTGSMESRRPLKEYGKVEQKPFKDIISKHISILKDRLGGKLTSNPSLTGTLRFLEQLEKDWSPKYVRSGDVSTATTHVNDLTEAEDIKNLIQDLQNRVDYPNPKTGEIMKTDSARLSRLAGELNEEAKKSFVDFEPIMKDVSSAKKVEQQLLENIGEDQPAIERSIRKFGEGSDETGTIGDTLKQIEERTGHQDIVSRIKLAAEKEGFEKKYGKKLSEIKDIDKMSTKRLIDLIHNIEKNYPELSDLSSQLRQFGEMKAPGFTKSIEELDLGKDLIKDIEKLTRSSGTFKNIMRAVGSEKEGYVEPRKLLERIGQLTGNTDLVENAERWQLQKHFGKDVTQGSKGVRLVEGVLSDIPGGSWWKVIAGALRDAYGAPMAKSVIKKVAEINEGLKKGDKLSYKILDQVLNRANKGNIEAIIVSEILRNRLEKPSIESE